MTGREPPRTVYRQAARSDVIPATGKLEGSARGNQIRAVIGEDTYLVREAVEQILTHTHHIEVVGSAGDRDSLLDAVEARDPDVVVTDIRMPPTGTDEGIQVAQALRDSHPQIGVVVLSQFADPEYVLGLLESGSEGRAYLLKERVHDADQLIAAVDAVVAGESVVDPKVVELLAKARSLKRDSPLSDLTPREREVLAQIAEGKSNAAIAQSLVLTKHAVERHINSIFTKLQLGTPAEVSLRVKAVLLFLASGERRPPG
jgi:DNA-binding NarL/FixJ family response regulator